MLGSIKAFLRVLSVPFLYLSGYVIMLFTIFREVTWGFFLLVFLIPQPNVWYKFHEFPLGKDFLDLIYFSIILGLIVQQKGFSRDSNNILIIVYVLMSYVALWNASLQFGLPMPISSGNFLLKDWKNYGQMILLYFIAKNAGKDEKYISRIVMLMAAVVLLVGVRSYRNFDSGSAFSYDRRVGGPFENVGLGPNHIGAFACYYMSFFFGVLLCWKDKIKRWLLVGATAFSLHPLLYSYSRGAYLAALSSILFLAIVRMRSLLILLIVLFVVWQSVLPSSVVDRITMTTTESGELESSAAQRLSLWDQSLSIFLSSPVLGVGFGGFGLSVPEGQLTDTHNFYMKTLCEQGAVGMILLGGILSRSWWSGWQLFRKGSSELLRGIGLGFAVLVVSTAVANVFGDRWSYFVLGGYFWTIWGLVDRGRSLSGACSYGESA